MPKLIEPCYVYVDGLYVRETLKSIGLPEEFNPYEPAKFIGDDPADRNLPWMFSPVRIFYYDAVDDAPTAGGLTAAAQAQRVYFARLEQLPDIHVVRGYVRIGRRGPEYKGIAVQLAVDALEAATSLRLKAIGLIAGDEEFAPLAASIRRAGPHVYVLALEGNLDEELRRQADRVIWLRRDRPSNWGLPPPSAVRLR